MVVAAYRLHIHRYLLAQPIHMSAFIEFLFLDAIIEMTYQSPVLDRNMLLLVVGFTGGHSGWDGFAIKTFSGRIGD